MLEFALLQATNAFYILPIYFSNPSRKLHRASYLIVFATSVVYHSKLVPGFWWDVFISTACGAAIYIDTRSRNLLTWTHYVLAFLYFVALYAGIAFPQYYIVAHPFVHLFGGLVGCEYAKSNKYGKRRRL